MRVKLPRPKMSDAIMWMLYATVIFIILAVKLTIDHGVEQVSYTKVLKLALPVIVASGTLRALWHYCLVYLRNKRIADVQNKYGDSILIDDTVYEISVDDAGVVTFGRTIECYPLSSGN